MELRPYQKEDVAKLLTKDSMGIFNEQRTGKTPTAIAVMQERNVDKLLIVCPASMLYVWKQEYEAWTNKQAYVYRSKQYIKHPYDWQSGAFIISYDNIKPTATRDGLVNILLRQNVEGLIVDEAHRCKSQKSINYKAIKALNRIPYRLYLTGTPAPNEPWEVWAILNLIDPKTFSSYWNFISEYFLARPSFTHKGMDILGYSYGKEAELLKTLNEYSTMRKRKDVMTFLPVEEPPIDIKLPCTAQQKKYLNELAQYFETEQVVTQGILDRIVRVRQICGAPKILDLKGNSPKLDWVVQYLKDYPDKSVIIFSNSTKLLSLLSDMVDCKCIVGETPILTRVKYVQDFQAKNIKVLLIQTQSGKEGLTLDQADVTIFLDTYPPAVDYMQAKDRIVATSAERVKPKQIIRLMMEDTYDERLYSLVDNNIKISSIINDYISYIKGGK